MGTDKALLPWQGDTLLRRTLAIARAVCGQAFICGSRSLYGGFGEVLEDAEPGRGPLSGIQAALHATQTELNLILSVDLPLMQADFLAWLLQRARRSQQLILVPQMEAQLQPLCAVYHRETREVVDEALARGNFKVTQLFRDAATRIVEEKEIRAAGFSAEIFTNVNTPEEYASLYPGEMGQA